MLGLQFNATFQPRKGYTPTAEEVSQQMALSGCTIWHAPRLELIEKPTPTPRDDEVLIKVGACGVCGSDTAFLRSDEDGYLRFGGHCKAPTIIGHEYSGEVAAVGKNVSTLKTGDLVVAETMNWCGECNACRQGMFNQCGRLEEIGFTIDGGFAEYFVAREKYCFNVNEFLGLYETKERALEVAALIEPFAVAYHGLIVRSGGFRPGSYVAVTGCGPVGLAAVALARVGGAAKVIAIDLSVKRLALARELGADVVLDPADLARRGGSVAAAVMEATQGYGAMVHVEATEKVAKTIPQIESSLAVGAKVVQIGLTGDKVPMSPVKLQQKDAVYSCSIGSSGHGIWQDVIRLIASRRLDIEKMIFRRYPLKNALEAIETAEGLAPGKILVTPHW